MTESKDENRRCFLYSADCPEGKIFTGVSAIAAAMDDGWQDRPMGASKTQAEIDAEEAEAAAQALVNENDELKEANDELTAENDSLKARVAELEEAAKNAAKTKTGGAKKATKGEGE